MTPEADLGMFSMFGRTGAPTKGGPHRPEIVGRQHDISDLWDGAYIYAVLRHLKLKSSRRAELHSLACGLWVGALYTVLRNLKFST